MAALATALGSLSLFRLAAALTRPDRGKLEQVCHGLNRIVDEGDSSKRN